MNKYNFAKIYKIYSVSANLFYYGSTIQSIPMRMTTHLRDYRRYKNKGMSPRCSSYKVLDCPDWKVELVEEYCANDKYDLAKREGEFQRNNECVNKNIAGRTKEEYRMEKNKLKKKKENE